MSVCAPAAALAGLVLLAATGCGYALVGKGITVDPSIRSIGVPLFQDQTGKPGLDQQLTEKVIEELLKRGRFDVVQRKTDVDALVEGEIVSYEARPIGFSEREKEDGADPAAEAQTEASRYAVTLTARVVYRKTDPSVSEPIWQSGGFAFTEEYDVGDDPTTFFDREEQAIDRLTTSFARSLVATMLEAF